MRFLRLLSESARQNFTYTCVNSVAWYDDRARNYKSALRFLGDNEATFSAGKNKPRVTHDGCRVRGIQKKEPSIPQIIIFVCSTAKWSPRPLSS